MSLPDGPTGLALFARALRAADIRVLTSDLIAAGEALQTVVPVTSARCYWILRATLRIPPDRFADFDGLFEAWILGVTRQESGPTHQAARSADQDAGAGDEAADDGVAAWSVHERLKDVRLEDMGDEQLELVDRLLDQIWTQIRRRPTRRRRSTLHGGDLDLRRTARASRRLGGETLTLHRRRRRHEPRRLVLLLDVSGSMAPLTRPLLHLAHLARCTDGRTEAFAFGTQLTRVTQQLEPRRRFDPQLLISERRDWGGGTRTATALAELRTQWAPRGILRGSTVVVISDGLDGGDVDRLDKEMARLARATHRIVWASPLVGGPGYRPVQRALRAALPHVDELVSVRTFADVEVMARRLGPNDVRGAPWPSSDSKAAVGGMHA